MIIGNRSDPHAACQEVGYARLKLLHTLNMCLYTISVFKMSFDDLAKYGGLYGSEGVLKNIKVSTYACV